MANRLVELDEKALVSNQGVDFVLVTALPEERDAVLDKLPGYRRLPPSEDDIRTYFEAELLVTFPGGVTGIYRVIMVSLLGMGRLQAVTATADAIRRWQPRYIVLVGIAGGVAAQGVRIGDILISDQIVDYELQKITSEGPVVRWDVQHADPRLLNACQHFMSENWQELVRVERLDQSKPKRHVGPIASGDKVIAFGEVLKRYREVWPKLIGVEMEAAGVATAAFQSSAPPGFFMVRCVSDLADEDKGSADVEPWRPYACDAAASFAIALLKSGPVPLSSPEPTLTGWHSVQLDRLLSRVRVPAGDFLMGSDVYDCDAHDNEKPRHRIYLEAYEIGRYPVTNAQYRTFVESTRHRAPTHWPNAQPPPGKEEHPVVNVSLEDARAFCSWLTRTTGRLCRLPTEAEWEKAARGALPDRRRYLWGDEWLADAANTKEAGYDDTTPVDAFEQRNKSPFGAVDMAGNVMEWTNSEYKPHQGSVYKPGVFGSRHVVRGGCYILPRHCARVSWRGRYRSDITRPYLGFRVVLQVE